jgi:hypothetical protein
MRYKSIAYWPHEVSLGNAENSSSDTHYSKEEAEWVAKELRNNGFGGMNKIYPLKVEIIPVKEENHG